MKHKAPLVSVITVCLNGSAFLEQTIQSVLSQTYPNIEYIIIDGGSSDGSVEIIRNYAPRLAYWHSKPDRGLSHAFNLGLEQVHGDWILFLNADDILLSPDVIATIAPYLETYADAEVVFGQTIVLTREKRPNPSPFRRIVGHPWHWQEFRRAFTLPHQSAFTHRTLFARLGKFSEEFPYAMDYEFYLRRGKDLQARFVPLPISGMREGGISGKKFIRSLSYCKKAIILHHALPAWRAWLDFFWLIGRYSLLGPVIRKLLMLSGANVKVPGRNAGFDLNA